jgi:hypothetical protein
LVDGFDYFATIPNSKTLHQNARGYHHGVDEWWDDNIAQHLMWLFRRKNFDILFVNYTFLAKAFEYAPAGVVKILDTHRPVFGAARAVREVWRSARIFFTPHPSAKRSRSTAPTR